MTTPRTRSLVSLAAALTLSVAFGGCLPARSVSQDGAGLSGAPRQTVRFENEARQYVHVYLVGEQREWLLGRVEPGASKTLRIPDGALAENRGFVRLAVLAGAHPASRAAVDPRAAITIAQPASAMLSQRWTFSQSASLGQLTSLPLRGARTWP